VSLRPTIFVACGFIVLLSSAISSAQVGTEGTILGVVTDSTGAAIPGAAVTVTNLDTNLQKTATTGSTGNFEVTALPRGVYAISASLPGFKTWQLAKTELTLGERKRVTPVLEVGDVVETLTVERQTPLMQTEKGSLESIVEQKQILELPLLGRNPVELVQLVPGMRFTAQKTGPSRGSMVQGLGNRTGDGGGTEFQMDGLIANEGRDEGGIAIPNVDAIAEFNVETANFSAEHGRNPIQVLAVTKAGTNELRGSAWEFHRNDALDARNAFATTKPKLIRNQFGLSLGGPILKDETFFFTSYEGTRIREERIYNSTTIRPEFLEGDFSNVAQQIIDPETGQPFPGNIIPGSRISDASKALFPFLLLPNPSDGRYRAVAPTPNDEDQFLARIDHQLSNQQRIYGRYIITDEQRELPQYRPDVIQDNGTRNQNIGINYSYTITPTTLFTFGANYLRSMNRFTGNQLGEQNITEQAGIQGFPTAGREDWIGFPDVGFTNYTGFAAPWGTPGILFVDGYGGKASISSVREAHSLNAGYEFNTRRSISRHGTDCSRGCFDFNGQYTGDSFADYLLGLPSSSGRNFPIHTFGASSIPYSALYIQDYWQVASNVSLNLGLRWDYWHKKGNVRGQTSRFDLERGMVIAGEDKDGHVDLTAQPVAPFVAAAFQDQWISASEAGLPAGLSEASGYFSPRVGVAWRPLGRTDLVVRAGYGIFTSAYTGNRQSSSVSVPFFVRERRAWSAAERQPWETAWSENPAAFGTPEMFHPTIDIGPNKAHQWNVSIQQQLPGQSAVTLSYAGNRVYDLFTTRNVNEAPPGPHPNLQAARPFPTLGPIRQYYNGGDSSYHSLQLKLERRFSNGLSYTLSYAFSKQIDDNVFGYPGQTPFEPEGYYRGRSGFDRTHILAVSGIYELPFGRGKKFLDGLHPVANGILGGWQLASIYNFVSGVPLTFDVAGDTLGNGWRARPNLVGDLKVADPSPEQWFNVEALEAPPPFEFGNAGFGIFDGPGFHGLDVAVAKRFSIGAGRYLQVRVEAFNLPNHVNLCDPENTVGIGTTGQIFCAGSARSMQVGMKLVF
jgi:outer membrane receptor protein involved in Fe transport